MSKVYDKPNNSPDFCVFEILDYWDYPTKYDNDRVEIFHPFISDKKLFQDITQYSDFLGKTKQELKNMLVEVNEKHYQLNKKYGTVDEYKDVSLDNMIKMFAEDDFYKYHLLSQKYLRLNK